MHEIQDMDHFLRAFDIIQVAEQMAVGIIKYECFEVVTTI